MKAIETAGLSAAAVTFITVKQCCRCSKSVAMTEGIEARSLYLFSQIGFVFGTTISTAQDN